MGVGGGGGFANKPYSLPSGELAEEPLRKPGELGTPRFMPALP